MGLNINMKPIPFTLRADCVQYRVVELESLNQITLWAIACPAEGADVWFDFSNRQSWVIVPESQLMSFLSLYGSQVSAV